MKIDPYKHEERYFNWKAKLNNCIPFSIPKYCSDERKQKLLKHFKMAFYEKRAPTTEEMLESIEISKNLYDDEEKF